MKKLITSLAFLLVASLTFATEIEAVVVFENFTNKKFTTGEFKIIGLNKKVDVSKAESFKIVLPEKGKYQFSFVADDFNAYVFYPNRINKRHNTITIRLMEKTGLNNDEVYNFPMNLDTDLTDEQIESRIANGTLNFIMHGIGNVIPEDYVAFKASYGIGLKIENCAMDPMSFKLATENNQMIFDYLNKKYGTQWLNTLDSKPFGIK